MASLASVLFFQERLSISSHSRLAKKLSGIAYTAHRRTHVHFLAMLTELNAGILTALIAVVNHFALFTGD
jgi:hypothetical protein